MNPSSIIPLIKFTALLIWDMWLCFVGIGGKKNIVNKFKKKKENDREVMQT